MVLFFMQYAITLNPIPSSAGEADADVPQTVNFQDVGLRHREATENRETPGKYFSFDHTY